MTPSLISLHASFNAAPIESEFTGTTRQWSGIFLGGITSSVQKSK